MNTPIMIAVDSQKNAKIFRKRLRILSELFLSYQRVYCGDIHVACVSNGLNTFPSIGKAAEFFTKFADMHVDTAIKWTKFASENHGSNLVPAHNISRRS